MNEENQLQEILKRLRFQVEFEPLAVAGASLEVLNILNMPEHLDGLVRTHAIQEPIRDLPLWAKVWPSSLVLGHFLRNFNTTDKTMLEIGGGMGVCSLIAARHGFKHIVTTDVNADALDFARANVFRNRLESIVSVVRLDIANAVNAGHLASTFDFICASELLYLEDLHRPILKFIRARLAPSGHALFCMDAARYKKHFIKRAGKYFHVAQHGITLTDENQIKKYIVIIDLTAAQKE